MAQIEITIGGKELKREVWTFTLIRDVQLRFTRYVFQARETKRHGWKTQTIWDWYDRNRSDIPQPPLTEDMKDLAKRKLMEMIVVL